MSKTLAVRNIKKSFGATHALKDVSIPFEPGKVHVLIGENGAGKSTLLKIVSGVFPSDSGEVLLNGETAHFRSPMDARKASIAMVYQELTLSPEMTVLDNIFLGVERLSRMRMLNKKQMRNFFLEQCAKFGLDIPPDELIKNLSFSHQQLVEVLKALVEDPEIVIFDEATSALDNTEVKILFSIIRSLKESGKTVIFISHRMEEIFEIGDTVSVLKDGELVITSPMGELNQDRLIEHMVGRAIEDVFPPKCSSLGDAILEISHLQSKSKKLKDINIKTHYGEIVGIAGLQGHGQSELLDSIAGIIKYDSGRITLKGKAVSQSGPRKAIKRGIVLLPTDRKTEALFMDHSVHTNLSVSSLRFRQAASFINKKKEKEFVDKSIKDLSIKCHTPKTFVNNLSGGNQQKVVLGRVLGTAPNVILFNEPTRGVDVQTKQEFYFRMRELANAGICIILYSSDLLEVIGISDTVYTMFEGAITGVLQGNDINEVQIMRGAVGLSEVVS